MGALQQLTARLRKKLMAALLGASMASSAYALPVRVEGSFNLGQEQYDFLPDQSPLNTVGQSGSTTATSGYPSGPWFVEGRPDVLSRLEQTVRDVNGQRWGTIRIRITGQLSEPGRYGANGRCTHRLQPEHFEVIR